MSVDLLIRGGSIIDGTGVPARDGDVAVSDGRIVAVGAEASAAARDAATVIDAADLIVAPGFIDIHTHSDVSLFHDARGQSKVSQGVTTDVTGNCSFSAFPIDEGNIALHRDHLARIGDDPITPSWRDLDGYAAILHEQGLALNIAPLVGHGTLRVAAMGVEDRPPSSAELDHMAALAEAAVEQGAFGMSTGLTHVPSAYAREEEIHALAAVMARHGRLYATHARARAGWTLGAIDEAVAVGSSTGVRVQFSHVAINEPSLWGRADLVLERFERARRDGVDITFDVYPYDASSSSLTQYLPGWLQEGGSSVMAARLADPETRRGALEQVSAGWWDGIPWHWDRVRLSRIGPGAEHLVGLSMEEAAAHEDVEPAELMLDLCERFGNEVEVVLFYRTEEDMLRFLLHPLAMAGSDGKAIPFDQGADRPHPRSFGTFPRILGRFVRERGLLELPAAIAKMTSVPADRVGIPARGRLRAGDAADIVVFDAERIIDTATFEQPTEAAAGISHVIVAGVPVVRDGRQTDSLPGAVLRAAS